MNAPYHPVLVPVPDGQTQVFWDGCREGKLVLQRCGSCGGYRYPPRPSCPQCTTPGGEWVATSGRGTLYSWIVVHHPVHADQKVKVPYNVVMVELEEGPHIVSELLDVEFGEIRPGLKVSVVFEELTPTISLPKFRLVE